MTTRNVLAFEPDGRPIEFIEWLDDLQLFLLINAKDGVSLFDYMSGTAVAPAADAPALERSQWQTRDAAARLAIRNHLQIIERTNFSQHKTAKTLYDAVVPCYSSPATAALALDPTTLIVDNFEKHLLVAEKNILAVGASRGTPRSPLLEGCSHSPLTPSYASAAAALDYLGAEEVGVASVPSGKRRSGRGGKGGRGGGGGGGGGGGAGGGGGGGGGGGRGSGGGGGGGGNGGGTGSGGGGSGGSGGGGSGGGICVLARFSTLLPCPAVPSGELSGLHLPSFSTSLVSNAVL
ncbi:unnamed protein product [Closterium sp. NIES-65]|nr:unnamed protein product [Closterium sp. NIES-65]